MEEEVQLFIDDAKEKMEKSMEHLNRELAKIRAGKASPSILDVVSVDYYGTLTPLSRVSSINSPDARTLRIQPWEKNMIGPIEKAIMKANLGFNPSNNGEVVIINIPVLTEERRMDLAKQVKAVGENAKVSIRSIRRDTNEELKSLQKDGMSEDAEKVAETVVQELTNKFNKLIDDYIVQKENDIMTI
ncbi:MAG: ribosome recycling factor [Bacteroidetes bacterium]|nr:ribosome recycling factor [Bacteroidota bacterium]